MDFKPQAEHKVLERLVGTWDVTCEFPAHDDHPSGQTKGTEVVRSLGGTWFVAEGRSQMPGSDVEHTTVLTLGYDPAKGQYVGTWIGSMMPTLWIYDKCTFDGAKNTLTMESTGPSFNGKGEARYRDVLEFKSDDLRTLTGAVKQPDGTWHQMMTITYRRRK